MKWIKDGVYFGGVGSIVVDGVRIFNPTDLQLITAGWLVYVPKQPLITVKTYENAVDNHINNVARANDFDSILTCTKYSGFDNAFRAHALALLNWNAECWVTCHTILDLVQAGTRQQPTVQQLLSELPVFTYTTA